LSRSWTRAAARPAGQPSHRNERGTRVPRTEPESSLKPPGRGKSQRVVWARFQRCLRPDMRAPTACRRLRWQARLANRAVCFRSWSSSLGSPPQPSGTSRSRCSKLRRACGGRARCTSCHRAPRNASPICNPDRGRLTRSPFDAPRTDQAARPGSPDSIPVESRPLEQLQVIGDTYSGACDHARYVVMRAGVSSLRRSPTAPHQQAPLREYCGDLGDVGQRRIRFDHVAGQVLERRALVLRVAFLGVQLDQLLGRSLATAGVPDVRVTKNGMAAREPRVGRASRAFSRARAGLTCSGCTAAACSVCLAGGWASSSQRQGRCGRWSRTWHD